MPATVLLPLVLGLAGLDAVSGFAAGGGFLSRPGSHQGLWVRGAGVGREGKGGRPPSPPWPAGPGPLLGRGAADWHPPPRLSHIIAGRSASGFRALRASAENGGGGGARVREPAQAGAAQSTRAADLRLEEAATRYGIASLAERAAKLRQDIFLLEQRLEEERENVKWEELLDGIESEEGGVIEGGQPWEVDDDAFHDAGIFLDEDEPDYTSMTEKPVEFFGSFEGGTMNGTETQSTFDMVIAEQKARNPSPPPPEEAKRGIDEADFLGSLLRIIKEEWEVAEAEAEADVQDAMKRAKMRRIERTVALWREGMREASSEYAEAEHREGRAELDGHRLPWEAVEERMEGLLGRVLREVYEGGAEGTLEERRKRVDEGLRERDADSVLRMPRRRAGWDGGEGGLEEGEGELVSGVVSGEPTPPGLMEEGRSAIEGLRDGFDAQIQEFKEQQEAICFGTDELIRDRLRWWPEESHPAYSNVDEFRAYVARLGDEGKARKWSHLPSLFLDREEAVRGMFERRKEARRGMRARGEIGDFNAIAGDARAWREVEEIAESEWRFYDPEQYYAFEQLRDRRDEMLGMQRAREERIMSIAAEAEVSLDEFIGVMIDLGFATSGSELVTADPYISVISGKGRELGLDGGVERWMYKAATTAIVGLTFLPLASEIARAAPLAQAGLLREADGLAAWAWSVVGVVEQLGGWGFVFRALLLGDSSFF